jgi:hypothetical protein
MISLTLNEAQAEWGVTTLTRIAEGVATGGLALPELMALSFADYVRTVQGLTPPAKGARVVGSVDLSRGKAAIDVDLGRAFVVTARGVVDALPGGDVTKQLAGAAALSWYERQRRNGRFTGRVKMVIDRNSLNNIRTALHRRVGYLLSGWNAAAARFRVQPPSWVSGKAGRGTVQVSRTSSRLAINAANQVNYAGGIPGMQRRMDAAGRIIAARMERKAAAAAEKAMQQQIT